MPTTFRQPLKVTSWIRRLGAAGAHDNARRACEEHDSVYRRIELLGQRIAPSLPSRQAVQRGA